MSTLPGWRPRTTPIESTEAVPGLSERHRAVAVALSTQGQPVAAVQPEALIRTRKVSPTRMTLFSGSSRSAAQSPLGPMEKLQPSPLAATSRRSRSPVAERGKGRNDSLCKETGIGPPYGDVAPKVRAHALGGKGHSAVEPVSAELSPPDGVPLSPWVG